MRKKYNKTINILGISKRNRELLDKLNREIKGGNKMNYNQNKKDLLIELIEEYNTKNKDKQFTGIDVDIETSLFEYGLLVSKENNNKYFVLYCIDYTQFDDNNKIMFDYTRIDINDLIDDLNNIDNSFYSFIDMQKNDVINETKNTKNIWFIAHMIYSINQYNGLYNDTCNYNDSIDTWINYFKNLLEVNNVKME